MADRIARRAFIRHQSFLQDNGPPANRLHLIQIMRHIDQGCAVGDQLTHLFQAAKAKDRVTHRKHFIDQQDVGLNVGIPPGQGCP